MHLLVYIFILLLPVCVAVINSESSGFPRCQSGKESTCQCRRHKRCELDLWVGKIPWSRKWQPTPKFLPGKFHGQSSLVGYSPWHHKESDTTEQLNTHTMRVVYLKGIWIEILWYMPFYSLFGIFSVLSAGNGVHWQGHTQALWALKVRQLVVRGREALFKKRILNCEYKIISDRKFLFRVRKKLQQITDIKRWHTCLYFFAYNFISR